MRHPSQQTLADFLVQHDLDPSNYPERWPIGRDSELLTARIISVAEGPSATRAVFLEGGFVIVEAPFSSWLVS